MPPSDENAGSPDPLRREISRQRWILLNARREYKQKAMADYDKQHYARLKILQDSCGDIGHMENFSHTSPNGPVYICATCGKTRVERE